MRRALVVFAGVVALMLMLMLGLAGAPGAFAQESGSWWGVDAEVVPGHLPPGGEGEIVVVVSSLGYVPANGSKSLIVITDVLPPGLEAIEMKSQLKCELAALRCTFAGSLWSYERVTVAIKVRVTASQGVLPPNTVSVEGGGAPAVSRTQEVTVSAQEAPFGVQGFELAPEDAGGALEGEAGSLDARAGSHPFQLVSTLSLNQKSREPVALPKDLSFDLPPGVIGNPNATEQCTMTNFYATAGQAEVDLCPPGSAVGVATVTADEPSALGIFTKTVPVFNLVPSQGEPARFGFEVIGKVPIVIDTSVRTGGDYSVVASVKDATQTAGLLSSQVTLWGVPGDPRHDSSRGWECVAAGYYQKQVGKACPASSDLPEKPFLTLPTYCAPDPSSEPLSSSLQADSWAQAGSFVSSEYTWLNPAGEPAGLEGCDGLPFDPTIQVAPEEAHTAPVRSASTPTGLSVNVEVPQSTTLEENLQGRAEADVRDTTVTLPEGVQLNPSAANGLTACTEEEIGYEGLNPKTQTQEFTPTKATATGPLCPEASRVAVVHVRTPFLSHELEGELYLAEPAPNGEAGKNPFDSLVALYLVAEDPISGVLVKLVGEGKVNPSTGRVSTTFTNAPQGAHFEDLKVELFGGDRASLSTPAFCGDDYGTEAQFTPWSGTGTVNLSSAPQEFVITSAAGGSPCPPDPLGFSPSLQAQSTNGQAGAFTPFELEIARPDGDQALRSFSLGLPPGLAAVLASVTPCPEPQAAQGTCGEESLIGHSLASSGVGSEPYELPGKVYLTGPYGGAPFGLSSVTPLENVGPFDLGRIVVRSGITIDSNTAQASIDTSASTLISSTGQSETFAGLPERIKGIPAQLKQLTVSVDRSGFTFNPTNCSAMAITATLNGWQGASDNTSYPFQASNCHGLPFHPTLTASTKGQASKADGTNLNVTVTSAGVGQANIQKVNLQLPKALSSRLTTLQKACTEAAFNANPASCDPESVIGHATIHTPVLKNPLSGPAYLVSHGGAAFPDLEFVLQGEGIKIVLDGKTDIKEGITYSKFESAPDAPFTVFETELPAGPDSILTANVPEKEDFNLCKASLTMPTTIVAQDGAVLEPSTKIVATGCGEVKSAKVTKLTLAQQLARALAKCRSTYKHSKSKRVQCERAAHARYTSLALVACRKQDKHSKKKRASCEALARRRYGARKTSNHG